MSEENAGAGEGANNETGAGGGGDNGQAPVWSDGLSNKQQEFVTKSGFKDPGAVIDQAMHAQQLLGVKDRNGLMVKPSGSPADNPDDWKDIYTLAGRPDAVDGYSDLPDVEGVNLAEDAIPKLKEMALAHNLSDAQFTGFVEAGLGLLAENANNENGAAQAELETMGAALQKEWGQGYEGNVESAKGAIAALGDKDFVNYLETTGLGDDPRMIRTMHKLAGLLGESGGLPGNLNSRGEGGGTKAAAEEAYAAHMKKYKDEIFNDKSGDGWATKKRMALKKAMGDFDKAT